MATAAEIEIKVDDEELDILIQKLERHFDKTQQSGTKAFRKVTNESNRAKDAVSLFSRVLGVQIPRQLEGVIGRSNVLGSAFSAAFNVSVVAAFGYAIIQTIPKIARFIDELRGITDEMEKQYDLAVKFNDAVLGEGSKDLIAQRISALKLEQEKLKKAAAKGALFDFRVGEDKTQNRPSFGLITGSDAARAAREQYEQNVKILERLEGKLTAAAGSEADERVRKAKEEADKKLQAQQKYTEESMRLAQQLADAEERARLVGIDGVEAVRMKREQELKKWEEVLREHPELHRQVNALMVEVWAAGQREITSIVKKESEERAKKIKEEVDEYARQYDKNLEIRDSINEQITDIDARVEAERRRLAGDSLGAFIVAEEARVDAALEAARKMGATWEQLARLEESLNIEKNIRIAEETQKLYQSQVASYENALDAMFNGNIADNILKNAKRFFVRILAEWFATMGKMQQGGGGGFLGGLISILTGQSNKGATATGGVGGGVGGLPPGVIQNFMGGGGSVGASSGSLGVGGIETGGGGFSPLGSAGLGGGTFGGDIFSQVGEGASSSTSAGKGGIFSRLGGGLKNIATSPLAMLGLGALGKKFGGTAGMIGAGLGGVLLASIQNPAIGAALGIAPGLIAPIAAPLIGFGVGMQHGPVAGALAGAGSGIGLGAIAMAAFAAGPIGLIIGGILGAIAGIFGGLFGGSRRRKQAKKLTNAFSPELQKIVDSYMGGNLDYASALEKLEELKGSAWEQFKKLKGEGKKEYNKVFLPKLDDARKKIEETEKERQRRATLQFAPPQFHSGGFVGGAMMGNGELLAILKRGEYVVNANATSRNRRQLEDINSGGTGGDTFIVQALDMQSFDEAMSRGGARVIKKHLRKDSLDYGGGN
jgi:hypothetical protein